MNNPDGDFLSGLQAGLQSEFDTTERHLRGLGFFVESVSGNVYTLNSNRQDHLDAARQQLRNYRKDKKAAAALMAVGESSSEKNQDVSEMAAWTTVASMILNLDETITKE